MRRLLPWTLALLALAPAATARAASVESTSGELRVLAAPGEDNRIAVAPTADRAWLVVTDAGVAPVVRGSGCTVSELAGGVVCPAAAITRVLVRAGDGDDEVTVTGDFPARVDAGAGDDVVVTGAGADKVVGGPGDDRLTTGLGADEVIGNDGADAIDAGPDADRVSGGTGADELHGGDGSDRVRGGSGSDIVDGGPGPDVLFTRDASADTGWCGPGRDVAEADMRDQLDPCEAVDYGPAGIVGRIYVRRGGGRFARIPGQPGKWIDQRLVGDVLYFVRRYHVRVTDGFSTSAVHAARGEHPLGLAVDLVPGPGGTWNDVDRLAKWAEPRQNHPRWPFRWVGYDGDPNHGRGNHLHLSWAHSPGRAGRPVKDVWLFAIEPTVAHAAASSAPPTRYVPPAPQR